MSPEEVQALSLVQKLVAVNRFQERCVKEGLFHPLTCGVCRPPGRDDSPLVAHLEGDKLVLTCPLTREGQQCDYRQIMDDLLIEIAVGMSDEPGWRTLLKHSH